MMTEIWKPVPGYEGLYEVSNIGEIRSIPRHGTFKNLHILKGGHNKDGYKQISLTKNGKPRTFRVHRIVASVFIPNPMGYREINHKDEDKDNNNVENLEWCTRIYNMNYGTRNQRMSKPVILIKNNETVEFKSLTDAANYIKKGANISNISRCCKGLRKTAYGYVWKFKEVQNDNL